jgi:hypothetical protein
MGLSLVRGRPLPVLLVLEPTMVGRPWSTAVRHAASTLQAFGGVRCLDDACVRATLAIAVEDLAVDHVVLAGAGWGRPPSAWIREMENFAGSLQALLLELSVSREHPPPVAALWNDAHSGLFRVFEWDPASGQLAAAAPPSRALRALTASMVEAAA